MSEDPTTAAAAEVAASEALAATPTPTTDEMLTQLLAAQDEYRKDVAALKAELAAQRSGAPAQVALANAPSAEEALANRLAEIADYAFYCPGCGALYHYAQKCLGLDGSHPHAPIEVVSTDELKSGDPTQHTAAPATTT
jgi:hypothetical protein